jgi:hypothetical protein
MKLTKELRVTFLDALFDTTVSWKASRFWHKQHDITAGAPDAGFPNLVYMPSENVGPRFEIFQEKQSASTHVQEIVACVQHMRYPI